MNTTQVLTFLSKEVKLKLIIHLYTCHERECDVNDLQTVLNEKQPNISKHLGNLKQAGIVKIRKDGLNNYYYLDSNFAKKYGVLIEEIMNLVKEDVYKEYACKCLNDGHEQVHNHENHDCVLK
ncbi:ArsR/SmtB family transcription factor [Mycoplasmopsis verecunda]|uniref:ArsR family transcriptional regulator n=1 Tax=Mycoplasmopsis verecunda TaxID=171291 RepID=A0A1T4LFP6_9BACT|nr:metalloregulator ArsR/SmtB family transcription factor [Mycoplasmopsis verecunda]WPB54843.1 metalloregulator ArsR/SmtB family transcription factor [Mycoplasmopsis verecunda]SJZ53398.1 ArsR family transcriptional regulator [Mycoplasmopsis verecunda]